MNLTSDPWIPVVLENGSPDKVSLTDAFLKGKDIRDLAARPHERIALMRLLLCVAHAALDGPKDRQDWKTCAERLPSAAAAYLGKWRHAFELFGDGPRFLQVEGRGEATSVGLDKLDFVDADMTTLFNQDIVLGREFSDEWIVFRLLTYQCFAAGGTCGGSEIVNGKNQPQKGLNGPCRDGSALHCYLRHSNLINSLHGNLISKEDVDRMSPLVWGKPLWEFEAKHIDNIPENTGKTYLGRLVPISRSLWIKNDHKFMRNSNGLRYPSFSSDKILYEPVLTLTDKVKKGNPSRELLSANKGESIQHPWRELHSVLLLKENSSVGGPKSLANVAEEDMFDLWLGACVTSQAKIDDSVEFVFSKLPSSMLDHEILNFYENGVQAADRLEGKVKSAMLTYRVALEHPGSYDEIQKCLKKLTRDKRNLYSKMHSKAMSHYWTTLECNASILVASSLNSNLSKWNRLLHCAARSAYELACPYGTPRQMKAYALGLKELFKTGSAVNEPDELSNDTEEGEE